MVPSVVIGLRHYTLQFGASDEEFNYRVNGRGLHKSFIYVNWEVDIFYHTTNDAASLFPSMTMGNRYRGAVEALAFKCCGSFLFQNGYHPLKELLIARFVGKVDTFAIQQRIKNALPVEFLFRELAATEQLYHELEVHAIAADMVLELGITEYADFDDELAEKEAWDNFPAVKLGLMEVKWE